MADLSHWDFAEEFSGYDAAALILGLEPRESQDEQGRVNVVEDRMARHYSNAMGRLRWDMTEPEQRGDDDPPKQVQLFSVQMKELIRLDHLYGADQPLTDWLSSLNQSDFRNQKFYRSSIVTWLTAIGMKSIYQFDLNQIVSIETPKGRWPWGDHHTELLGHLDLAARKFWVNYDPANPKATAPKAGEVINWLVTECKVSESMATSMATMLRPDDLKTGPRK